MNTRGQQQILSVMPWHSQGSRCCQVDGGFNTLDCPCMVFHHSLQSALSSITSTPTSSDTTKSIHHPPPLPPSPQPKWPLTADHCTLCTTETMTVVGMAHKLLHTFISHTRLYTENYSAVLVYVNVVVIPWNVLLAPAVMTWCLAHRAVFVDFLGYGCSLKGRNSQF